MTPRTQALPAPPSDSGRYWTVDLNEDRESAEMKRGPFLFRAPRYSLIAAAMKGYNTALSARRDALGADPVVRDVLPIYAAMAGLCWHHRVMALEVATPDGMTLDGGTLWRYGEAVEDEFLDWQEDASVLMRLGQRCFQEMLSRYQGLTVEAQERADFSEAPTQAPNAND